MFLSQLDVIKFKLTYLPNQAVCLLDRKNQDKHLSILRPNSLRWNKKAFFIISKGLSVAKNYLRIESAPLRKYFTLLTVFIPMFYFLYTCRTFLNMPWRYIIIDNYKLLTILLTIFQNISECYDKFKQPNQSWLHPKTRILLEALAWV